MQIKFKKVNDQIVIKKGNDSQFYDSKELLPSYFVILEFDFSKRNTTIIFANTKVLQ